VIIGFGWSAISLTFAFSWSSNGLLRSAYYWMLVAVPLVFFFGSEIQLIGQVFKQLAEGFPQSLLVPRVSGGE
jgi:hypothetical protein